jgi:hypothetical protein
MQLTIVMAEGHCDSKLMLVTLPVAEGHCEMLILAMGVL